MSTDTDYDLVVMGAGPGGYVSAIRASQLGMKVAIVEADKPGGVCLNVGCIPSKALIHLSEAYQQRTLLEELGVKVDVTGFDYSKVFKKSREAADRLSKGVQFLLKKNKVELIGSYARLSAPGKVILDDGKILCAKNILIATGSRPREIPGFPFDEQDVLSSTGALMLESLPGRILVLGGGAIGVEFAYIMNAFDVEVHLVEMLDQILPLEDAETVRVLARAFKKRGIKVNTSTKAISMKKDGSGLKITLRNTDGAESAVETDKVLVAVGRAPNTEDIGLEKVGIETEKGFIPVRDYYETSVSGIYAVGDVTSSPLLAHVASGEGEIAVEHMAGKNPSVKLDPLSIPSAVYSEPQLAGFGYTEAGVKEKGIAYRAVSFPYRGSGKAVAIGKPDGLVKVIIDSDTDEILGAHIVGEDATELIHELLLARSAELLPEDIADMIHAHPTLSETVMEGMRAVLDRAIHA